MEVPFPFDCVVFDLDGTLVATDRFWVRAARAGARRAFRELELERELPGADEWLGMVGLPLDQGFDRVFADLDETARRLIQRRCVEEEEAALVAGGALLMPGAGEVLRSLEAFGVRIGIASNCAGSYLHHMLSALDLGEYVRESRCLDSPGVHSKADMIADILSVYGTRSAVMVGDRAGDAEAAHANGIPHVHLADGLAPKRETVDCEATVAVLADLLPRLWRRSEWIEGALRDLGVLGGAREVRSLGIAGPPAAGKSLFARDAARLAAARGRAVQVVSRDGSGRFPAPEEADLMILDGWLDDGGPAPLEPDRTLCLACDDPTLLRRMGRIPGRRRVPGPKAELEAWRARELAAGSASWSKRADLVLDGSNPLGPARA
jgi:phosphoglycolate phosphatase-like HAD superfamily hydrolase